MQCNLNFCVFINLIFMLFNYLIALLETTALPLIVFRCRRDIPSRIHYIVCLDYFGCSFLLIESTNKLLDFPSTHDYKAHRGKCYSKKVICETAGMTRKRPNSPPQSSCWLKLNVQYLYDLPIMFP